MSSVCVCNKHARRCSAPPVLNAYTLGLRRRCVPHNCAQAREEQSWTAEDAKNVPLEDQWFLQDSEQVMRAARSFGLCPTSGACIKAALEWSSVHPNLCQGCLVMQTLVKDLCKAVDQTKRARDGATLTQTLTWGEIMRPSVAFLKSRTAPSCGLCEYINALAKCVGADGTCFPLQHQTTGDWVWHFFNSKYTCRCKT
jgi:hypothetical protein